MNNRLEWGIIGTGGIAADFTQALSQSRQCSVVNVVGSSPEKGAEFAKRHGVPRSAQNLEQLLADDAVGAVYVATPHPLHRDQAIACIEAGKHVLCEKPLCVTAADTQQVIDKARAKRVFLMEAFMYRCHPLMTRLIDEIKAGTIGKIVFVRADFGFRLPRMPEHRLFNPALGGGGILDVGGYPVSFARLLAGLVAGKPFEEPKSLKAIGRLGPTGIDEYASALLEFESGFAAQVGCGVFHDLGTQAEIFGEAGRIVLPNPWIPGGDRQRTDTEFSIHRDGADVQTVRIVTDKPTYGLEAELVANSLPKLEAPWPAMSWDDTLGNMKTLDAWRAALGT
jgi:predicted dehydrogenase